MTIRNLAEANKALAGYVPLGSQPVSSGLNLDRITPLMDLIGNPQDELRVIHAAGTSGKTSTSYFITALLRAGGQKVGLTVSPHIDGVNERVQIDGVPLPEATFCNDLGVFLDLIKDVDYTPSYFEVMIAFSFWAFVRHGVDYAVIETGIGGLNDATNVADRADKICVITDIGFDHMDVLGNTLAEIATQKIGIAHYQNQVFMYEQSDEIMRAVHEWTDVRHATVHLFDQKAEQKTYEQDLITPIDYQRRNWLLAYAVYRYLQRRDGLKRLTEQALQESQNIQVPGRMDIRQLHNKTIIMDGAHNLQKMSAFIPSFQKLYPGVKPAILLSMKEGKEYTDIIPLLKPLAARIIVTKFMVKQDARTQSMDPEKLAAAFRDQDFDAIEVIPDQHQAFQALLKVPEEVCVITGTFYLMSQLRNKEEEL